MGKQVGFYMTHEDEQHFLTSIGRLAPVQMVYQMFADPSQTELKSYPSQMELTSLAPIGSYLGDTQICLLNPALGIPPKIDSYPRQPSQIDKQESEVVEFCRCDLVRGRYKPSRTWLNNGRLWFATQDMGVKKSEAFVKWADSLFRWIRRNYEKGPRGHYAAPDAFKLFKAGKLQLGPSDEPELSLEERKRIFGLL